MGEIVSGRAQCPPPTPPPTLPTPSSPCSCHKQSFVLYWKCKERKKKRGKKGEDQTSKNTGGEEAERQLPDYSHLLWDASLLLTGDNCFGGRSPLPDSGAFRWRTE